MLKTSAIYFVIRVLNGVLGLSAVFFLTRILTAEQYGVYALGVAVIGSSASILFQWITVAVSRFYSTYINSTAELIYEGEKLLLRVATIPFIIASAIMTCAPMLNVNPTLIGAIGIGIIASGIHSLSLQVANASGQSLRYGLLTISRNAIALFFAIVLIHFNYAEIGAIFGIVLGSIFSIVLFRGPQTFKTAAKNLKIRHQLIRYGLPLSVTYVSTMMLDVSDRFIISWWLGLPAVAGYAAAYDLAQQTIGALLNILMLVAYPQVTAAWETNGAIAARRAMIPLTQAMILGIPLLAGIFIGGAEEMANVVFGESIRDEAARIIPWIAIAITTSCFKSYVLDIAFQLTKATNTVLKITVFMAVINVILNIVLLPYFGVVGAAVATVIAFSIGAVLSWWNGRKLNIYSARLIDGIKMAIVLFIVAISMRFIPELSLNNISKAIFTLAIGFISYVIAIYLTDLGDIRSLFSRKIRFFLK